MGLPNPSRETKFSGANADREILIFPVELTTSRIGNLTRLILTLAICDDYTYISGHSLKRNSFPPHRPELVTLAYTLELSRPPGNRAWR